jgi:hypothetical protein
MQKIRRIIMLKNYNEILEIRAEGLCNSCDYGIDRCLKDGKAFCKHGELNKENEHGEQEDII